MTENAREGSPEPIASPENFKKYVMIGAPILLAVGAYAWFHDSGLSCSSPTAQETVGSIAYDNQALVGTIGTQADGPGVPVPVECAQDAECAGLLKQFEEVKAVAVKIADECNRIPEADHSDLCPYIDGDSQSFTAHDADGWGTFYYDETTSSTPASQRKIHMAKTAQPVIDQWKQAEASKNTAKNKLIEDNIKRANDAWDLAVKKVHYHLENIVMTATDKDTGSVSCKADLFGEVPEWGSGKLSITYTVEKTSDGETYATVWGI